MDYKIKKTCLNGWWDIKPVFGVESEGEIPRDGWYIGQYMVPSIWTKSKFGVRRKGEVYYQEDLKRETTAEDEFLFDAYEYPFEWSKTRSAWVRRSLKLEELKKGRRYFLSFDAIAPRGTLYINGVEACCHQHAMLPMEVDITKLINQGENEIAVLIRDYDRDEYGRTKTPSGNMFMNELSGMWQDVFLIERGEVYLGDITIRTSTRTGTIQVTYEITNASGEDKEADIKSFVSDWRKTEDSGVLPELLNLLSQKIIIKANSMEKLDITRSWNSAEWWSPENPRLYQIITAIDEESDTCDVSYERFGFREVWIEGPYLMLNDHPMHLFSDWGHKMTPFHHTREWIMQWFGMIKDGNMNHSRLHTHPHPQLYMELADEEGILITGETAIHGSSGDQAADTPEFWEAARDHVVRFIKRDKNHPSVVMWSVENEMRWNDMCIGGSKTNLTQTRLPELKTLFNEIDPSRPAYHEGDTSMWNERTVDIISRHYGKDCAGMNWWDRKKPLHSGEMAQYHYAGPNNALELGGDKVFADFSEVQRYSAVDAARIIEAGRTLGVSCFGPWNLSCLENLRMEEKLIKLSYEDYSKPGAKPLYVKPHSSEFDFWKEGKGYTPSLSFDIQAHAFRPFAIIDRSLNCSYFAGKIIVRELFLVNDSVSDVEGTLEVTLCNGKDFKYKKSIALGVKRGHVEVAVFEINVPETAEEGCYEYKASFIREDDILDTWSRSVKICSQVSKARTNWCKPEPQVAVFGPGLVKNTLETLQVGYRYIDKLCSEALEPYKILIMEKNTVEPGSIQNKVVQEFAGQGGRIIIMEQVYCLFPSLIIYDKPVLNAFVRGYGHDVLEGLDDRDFSMWGEDSYAEISGDSYVAYRMYQKDESKQAHFLLDSGIGGFGGGDLEYCPLFEALEGEGLIIACQLRLTDKMSEVPAAQRLFLNMLKRAEVFKREDNNQTVIIDGNKAAGLEEYLEFIKTGGKAYIKGVTEEALEAWNKLLSTGLSLTGCKAEFQAVRVGEHPLLSGISNADICGVEEFSYAPKEAENISIGARFLKPAMELEPVLVTPEKSCLEELYVMGGKTEPLRTHTLSRFLHKEKQEEAVVLGIVRVGEGCVVFSQFSPGPGKRQRFERLEWRVLSNLGMRFRENLLEGECVPELSNSSEGYPTEVFIHNGDCDDKLRKTMVEYTIPSMERMINRQMLTIPGWFKAEEADGVWKAQVLDFNKTSCIYYRINSPMARKNINTNLNIPNPEALTSLHLSGEGCVKLTVNGESFDDVELEGDAIISDISLEMGFNHILIQWKPVSEVSTIKMEWKNIMRRPEVGFKFC